jgi:uncharacterized cysteine cluster protein YcgN (CxxCxxCC family)
MKDFFEVKKLEEMSDEEWEMLCDGCALCCLHKLEDEDTGEVFYTQIACKQLNLETCQCKDYKNRKKIVPNCLEVRSLVGTDKMLLMPPTCAYRLLHEKKELQEWHPLISKRANSVHESGISVIEKAISEEDIDPEDLEDYIIYQVR